MRTLTGTAASEYRNDSVRIVWLVEIETETPDGSSTTLRYASRKLTLSGDAYLDAIQPNGITLNWSRVRMRGGLASVSSFNITLANAEGLSDMQDSYTLDNDDVYVYLLLCDGTETSADRVQVAHGVIEEGEWGVTEWRLRCIDKSDQDFTQIPTQKVNIAQHPYAPVAEMGKVIPVVFGNWKKQPNNISNGGNAASAHQHIAFARCIDTYNRTYTPDVFAEMDDVTTYGVYEWKEELRAAAEVTTFTRLDQGGNNVTSGVAEIALKNEAGRELTLFPYLPGTSNTVSDYSNICNFIAGEGTVISPGDELDVLWPGTPTYGNITNMYLLIASADEVFEYALTLDGTLVSHEVDIHSTAGSIYSALDDQFKANWRMQGFELIIYPRYNPATIAYAAIRITYDQATGGSTTETLPIYVACEGAVNSSALQNYVIPYTSGDTPESPVRILAQVFTRKDLYNIPQARINTDAFESADDKRTKTEWPLSFQLTETVTWDYWNRMCFETGLHVFQDYEGKWSVVARDKDATPTAFINEDMIALRGNSADAEPDVRLDKTPTRDVINEVVLRYAYDPMSRQYLKMKVRTPQARYTGTCTVDAVAGTLTDTSATFSTGNFPAAVGERIYISDQYTVEVASVVSDTVLTVTPVEYDALETITTPTTYYGGSGISAKMVRSWLRYKTINPLGGEYDPVKNTGGWPSDFIYDDTTAENFLDMVEDWFSQRRIKVELATFMNALPIELGDVVFLRCGLLPAQRDAILLGELDGPISAIDTDLTCSTSGSYMGNEAFRIGDYLAIDDEVVRVIAEPNSLNEDLSIGRGEIGTVWESHDPGAKIYLLEQKWEVIGIKYDAAKAQIRLELLEMPRASYRSGAALSADATYGSAAYEDRVARSWAHQPTGLQAQVDPHTDYSYAR